MAQSAHFSIALCGISLWTKAASHCFEALRLLVEIINFLVEPGHLGFRRFSAAQRVERLANRKFGCFSHVSPSSLHRDRHPTQTKRGFETDRRSTNPYNDAVCVLQRRNSSAA